MSETEPIHVSGGDGSCTEVKKYTLCASTVAGVMGEHSNTNQKRKSTQIIRSTTLAVISFCIIFSMQYLPCNLSNHNLSCQRGATESNLERVNFRIDTQRDIQLSVTVSSFKLCQFYFYDKQE